MVLSRYHQKELQNTEKNDSLVAVSVKIHTNNNFKINLPVVAFLFLVNIR